MFVPDLIERNMIRQERYLRLSVGIPQLSKRRPKFPPFRDQDLKKSIFLRKRLEYKIKECKVQRLNTQFHNYYH